MLAVRQALTMHPALYNLITLPLGYLALTTTPGLVPIILLLTTILLQTTATSNRPWALPYLGLLAVNLAVASTLATLSASTTALSSTGASLGYSFLRGFLTAVIALVPLGVRPLTLRRLAASSWARAVSFPVGWVGWWVLTSYLSPTGRLGTWTPLLGDEAYRWMRPYVGLAGIDFVVAGWASIAAGLIGDWIQGASQEGDQTPLLNGHDTISEPYRDDDAPQLNGTNGHIPTTYRRNQPNPILLMTILLLALTAPYFHLSPVPLPVHSPDMIPVGVSCINPPHKLNVTHLELFLTETKAFASRARIHLWPEGAVSFDTQKERVEAVETVKNVTRGIKVWIGMSFEEPAPPGEGGRHHGGELKHTGMVLIGPEGQLFEYYKRYLVPIAESFSYNPANSTLPFEPIPYPRPPSYPKGDHTWPRNISTTASICLDFTYPLPHMPGHPALILAPANTWHPSIGLAMASLAAARADEVGAAVLWCDGGSGAVSGVYGAGRGVGLNVEQVGNGGSWLASIGVPYSEGQEVPRTLYAIMGDFGACMILLAAMIIGLAVEVSVGPIAANIGAAVFVVKTILARQTRHPVPAANLIDAED